ncbi:hypothetical protein NLX62_03755 [Mycobacteriaceae bacterium Msp059]|uniref:hypothetical protein n=1 Tax=Mycolicibacterium peregrinum TaxID=43304 RepID=UPI0012FF879E|nr:hypothetical protein [Mycolicibacterium peregrinum]MCP3811445.1 hypothetical protein [Mycobacteriaceae bacterium Msp059]
MTPRTCRNGGHIITGPGDVTPAGTCIRCARDNARRYRRRLVEASHRLKAIEAALA